VERARLIDRESWRKIGQAGYLGASMPEQYGGGDFPHEAIIIEELSLIRAHALQTSLHTGICMPYAFTTEAMRRRSASCGRSRSR